MGLGRLGVQFEGADVEVELVVGGRGAAIHRTGEPGVLERLDEPSAKQRRELLRPPSAGQQRKSDAVAHQNALAVEIEGRHRLGDAESAPATGAPRGGLGALRS